MVGADLDPRHRPTLVVLKRDGPDPSLTEDRSPESGVLVRDASGAIIGAVGISGDTGDNDEICAVAGIEAAGLRADTGPAA